MNRGYIKIYRKIFDHWLWDDSIKSKFEAWVLLLKMANHEDKKIMFNGSIVDVKMGDIITSEVKLSTMLKWSRTKVRKFLDTLSDDKMIVQKKDRKKTYLSICNYTEYHQTKKEKEQVKNIKKTSKKHKEELLRTKEETNYSFPENYSDELKVSFLGFVKNREELKKPVTELAFTGLVNKLNKLSCGNESAALEIIENSLINSWSGFFALKNKPALAPQKQLYATFED